MDKNLEDIIDKALQTGDQVVSIECPCCGKTYYITKSEAAYQYDNPADNSTLKLKQLGRKCPHCGFAGGFDIGRQSKKEQDIEQMMVEMEAEQMAQEAAEKRQASWAQICSQGVKFDD